MDNRLEIIETVANELKNMMFGLKADITDVMDGAGIRYKKVGYGHRNELLMDCSDWEEFQQGGLWGEPDGHYLFRVKVRIPDTFTGREVFFFMSTGADDIWNTDNPQMLVYINGTRRSGMDMNHNCVSVYGTGDWEKGTDRMVDIAIYAYSNLSQNGNYLKLGLAAMDETSKNAYFDLSVPLDAAKAMLGLDSRKNAIDLLSDKKTIENVTPVDQEHAEIILGTLDAACDLLQAEDSGCKGISTYSESSMRAMSEYLQKNLYGTEKSEQVVASTGHTHIDVAWKWPIRQTREKVIRSYSTVMELMKRYPEYLFMASTPAMYEFVREEEPELFEEIKERVKEGRFEPEGAMWLEADCNLTSGESLVRQILYGKRYFKEVFNVDSDILWLPDVFGYSAAMPQILKKSGIRAFVTTKLAWNDTNRMPHDFFMWKGIDESTIPTYLITTCDLPRADLVMKEGGILNYTYNGRQDASQIMGTWRAFREKEITNETLTVYGFGDGGGGPTWEMLEADRRLREGIPGCPVTVQKSVSDFMDGLLEKAKDNDKVPVWEDELYLEFHRGTYTSMGKNKRYNRELEILMMEAEILGVLNCLNGKDPYPKKELRDVWNIIMLNQFHDILPGSSIEEVYKVSEEDYKKAIDIVNGLIKSGIGVDCKQGKCIGKQSPISANCHMDVDRNDIDNHDTVPGCEFNGTRIETKYYVISFDKNAEIASLYDKEAGREVRDMAGVPINRLTAFRDVPQEYDAWNIDADFEEVSWDLTELDGISIWASGADGSALDAQDPNADQFFVDIRRRFRDSTITQQIVIKNNSRRIDFKTKADWHEHQLLLKAAFPVDIDSRQITCEIQYGSIKRNLTKDNSWDRAKFECCAHSWMDITGEAGDYGVAVLNDSKYGYDAKEKLMRLTLIKSGIFPNPNADQGLHRFTYSLLPHLGDLREGNVIEEAKDLNYTQHCYAPGDGDPHGFMNDLMKKVIDLGKARGVYIGAIKLAEDSNDVIIRLYEGHGRSAQVQALLFNGLDRDATVKEIYECDLLEQKISDQSCDFCEEEKRLSFAINPFEIKTFRIVVDQ